MGNALGAAVDVDTIVVGAGVVGVAVARSLALAGRETWVLESESRPGEGISSRNSGVIHAGFYYPPGSLKARLCCRGRDLIYAYCAQRGLPHKRTGKLLVATDDAQRGALRELLERGQANGVPDLRWIEADEARRLEPALQCVAAVDSPHSGIVDVPELVMALIGEMESRGGRFVANTRVAGVRAGEGAHRVELEGGDAVTCRLLVNAAGLEATELAGRVEGLAATHIPRLRYASGHYYTIRGRAPFQRLIYPLPETSGLGIHLGLDIAGRARFGPDLRWIPEPDYRFDDSQRASFAASIRRWWPALTDERLLPDFVGVRPKLSGPGEHNADFVIQDRSVHGIPGLVNLFGIESPGLTSSLAIGEEVASRLEIL